MGYNLLINGVYWGYNPFTKPLILTSWDIQVVAAGGGAISQKATIDGAEIRRQ